MAGRPAPPSKPHPNQRISTYVRCLSRPSGVQPDGSRLVRSCSSGKSCSLASTTDREIVKISEKDLRSALTLIGRFRERQAHQLSVSRWRSSRVAVRP